METLAAVFGCMALRCARGRVPACGGSSAESVNGCRMVGQLLTNGGLRCAERSSERAPDAGRCRHVDDDQASRRSFSPAPARSPPRAAGRRRAAPQDVIGDILKSVAPRQLGRPVRRRAPARATRSPPTCRSFRRRPLPTSSRRSRQYQSIVGAGRLADGAGDQEAAARRRRSRRRGAAQAPDDLRRPVARPPASRQSFDTYVDAAVKRFQARHGLPADGVLGNYTYAAMNVSAPVRLGQLRDQPRAPARRCPASSATAT